MTLYILGGRQAGKLCIFNNRSLSVLSGNHGLETFYDRLKGSVIVRASDLQIYGVFQPLCRANLDTFSLFDVHLQNSFI
jgi:hypothetical protein